MLIITMIVTGVISGVTRFILNKSLGPYMPETKKLNSYIKKFLLFIFLYACPVAAIIFLMGVPMVVDKSFVFCMVINFCALVFNFSNSSFVTIASFDAHKATQKGTLTNHFQAGSEIIKITDDHTEQIKKIEEALRNISR